MPENTSPDQPVRPDPDGPHSETAPLGASSGNRWEPSTPVPPVVPPAVAAPVGPPVGPPAGPPLGPPASGRSTARPGRTALTAGVAAAALVLVGAGAFAVGRASLDDHRSGFQVDQAWHGNGQGTLPGAPGAFPGDDDGPGDHDGDFGDHDED